MTPEEMQYINLKIPQSTKLETMNALYESQLIELIDLNINKEENNSKKSCQYPIEKSILESVRSKLVYLKNILNENNKISIRCCNGNKKGIDCICNKNNIEDLDKKTTKILNNILNSRELKIETLKRIHSLERELAITGELQFIDYNKNINNHEKLTFTAGTIEVTKLHLLKKTLKTLIRGNLVFHENLHFDMNNFCKLNNITTMNETTDYCIFIIYSSADSKRLDDISLSLGANILINKDLKTKEAINSLNELTNIYLDQNECYNSLLDELVIKLDSLEKSYKRLKSIYDKLCYGKVHEELIYLEGWIPTNKKKELKILGGINKASDITKAYIKPADITKTDITKADITNTNTDISIIGLFKNNTPPIDTISYELITIKDSILQDKNIGPVKLKRILQKPTYIPCLKIFQAFQDMSDSFGISTTNEINPAFFTIFLFPFLFGAMYSDILHGSLFIIAGILIIKYKEILMNIQGLNVIISGRYVIILNGISSVLWGLFFSEFAGIHLNNPLGIKKEWINSENSGEFINSLRLKLSLIIGFFHMLLGIFISLYNNIIKKEYKKILCFWLPQFIGYNSFFGYLIFLIYLKYITGKDIGILNILINMYTSPTSPLDEADTFFNGQQTVQRILVSLLVLSLPWMMLSTIIVNRFIPLPPKKIIQGDEEEEDHDSLLNYVVETMEFSIGLISNSSSYLRIWAINMAHGELSKVTFDLTIRIDEFSIVSLISSIIKLPIFLASTIFILVGLEGMSATLNAMRLNWIEFNSKFFKANGRKFQPLGVEDDEE